MNPDAFFGDYIYRSTDESAQRASLRGFEILSPGKQLVANCFEISRRPRAKKEAVGARLVTHEIDEDDVEFLCVHFHLHARRMKL